MSFIPPSVWRDTIMIRVIIFIFYWKSARKWLRITWSNLCRIIISFFFHNHFFQIVWKVNCNGTAGPLNVKTVGNVEMCTKKDIVKDLLAQWCKKWWIDFQTNARMVHGNMKHYLPDLESITFFNYNYSSPQKNQLQFKLQQQKKKSITITFGQLQLLFIDNFIFIFCKNSLLPIRILNFET
jgi:hypothetical protein